MQTIVTYFKDNVSYILPSYYSVEAIDSYPSDNYYSDYLLVSSAQEELYNFALKESSNEVDMRKDFIVLKIDTEISFSSKYEIGEGKTERLINICKQANANTFKLFFIKKSPINKITRIQ